MHIRSVLQLMVVTLASSLLSPPAQSLEVTAGDYEMLPAGADVALLYLQHAKRTELYVGGDQQSSNFNLDSSIGILRYIHAFKLGERATLDFNVILPFGGLKTSGDASVLGSASGVADIGIGVAGKFLLNDTTKDTFSVFALATLPTVNYDHNQSLNLGENRWRALLQLAYVAHFGPHWAIDLVGDIQVKGQNGQFGPAQATLKQAPRYEAQAHLRYLLSPATALSFSLAQYGGMQSEVNGVTQNDKRLTRYLRLSATHFLNPTSQIQAQLGQDISAENGPKEKFGLNLRLLKVF